MSSKLFKLITVIICICSLVSHTGCGLKLGEKNKSENIAEFKSASCLTQSLENLKLFFAGEGSGEQVAESILCLQEAIKQFKDNVRGKNPDAYTPDEVSNFVTSKLLKGEKKFSTELMSEVMTLKVFLVDGSPELITKTEVEEILNILTRLKPDLIKLAPHMKIMTSKWTPDTDTTAKEAKFVSAKEEAEGFLSRLGSLFAATERSYQLNDLVNLIIEICKFSDSGEETIKKISTVKGLLIKFKESLIGGDAALTGKEWLPFARAAGEVYFQLLRYKYFFDSLKSEQIAEKWKVHQKMAKDVGDLIRDLLNFKESHLFTSSELSELILTAQDLKYINSRADQKKFNQKGLDSLFKSLWGNLLNKPEARLAKKSLPGFTSEALTVLITEVSYFIENQIAIGELFAIKNEYTKDLLVTELSKRANNTGLQELSRVISAKGLMNFNSEDYLKILTPTNGLYHLEDLNKANLSRTLSRVIIRSYANDLERVNKLSGVTQEEAQFGFDQLRDLILNLELVAPDKIDSFLASRFREASLFLSVSDGDKFASFEEIDHLVLHIISGLARAQSLEKIAMQKCVKSLNNKVTKIEFVQECLLDMYYSEQNSFMDLPGFAALKFDKDEKGQLKTSPEDNKKYYLGLLSAAGHVENEQKTVFLGDAGLFPHVVQYVEMIFFTFDINRNGILEREEAFKAFPTFKNLIALVAKEYPQLTEPFYIGTFIYLLKNQRMPKKGLETIKFVGFVMQYTCRDMETGAVLKPGACNNPDYPDIDRTHDWDIQTTRLGVGKIFSFIADKTKP